ncbi:bifunctional adenosylcobinamide kinase/adenosylcobinamide-phosphate guanylyltransferase [Sporosarcina sp. NPDC096371]|uniref:bifunctional adenosylcobinamide kinase/adenosylcobinamide-phosphate guanylyltransferase n=1 Tax=Sporosarcina sp. NPDC096371 TaxID=3364530 RepID=UPI0038145097
MHVIIGGAYNGKRDYVRMMVKGQEVQWNCMGTQYTCVSEIPRVMVFTEIEKWLGETDLSEAEAIDYVIETVEGQDTIVIVTDIGRGIVPIDAQQRKLRDTCGRLYQRLIAEADEVTRIWYGLAQTLKKRGEV